MALSGAQRRKARVAAGLPRYTEAEAEGRKRLDRTRLTRHIDWISSIKIERGCTDCGYSDHPAALEFDHLPGFEKKFNIARAAFSHRTRKAIETEMAKCEVVCANCHRIRTAQRRLD